MQNKKAVGRTTISKVTGNVKIAGRLADQWTD